MNKEIGNKLIDFATAIAKFSKAIGDHSPTLEPVASEMRSQANALRDAINEAPVI